MNLRYALPVTNVILSVFLVVYQHPAVFQITESLQCDIIQQRQVSHALLPCPANHCMSDSLFVASSVLAEPGAEHTHGMTH